MRQSEQIADFVREALTRGRPRPEIDTALRSAGWSRAEIETALDAFADAPGLPPVPRPRVATSPAEALRHAIRFVTLGTLAVNLGIIGFNLTDYVLSDPLANGATDTATFRTMLWSVAGLLVALPLWAWLTLREARIVAENPGQRRSGVGRWLTAIAIFVAAVTLIGDLVAVIGGFLLGEMTARFLAKATIIGGLALGVYALVAGGLGDAMPPRTVLRARLQAALTSAVVLAAATAAFLVGGGPDTSRAVARDDFRHGAITDIAQAIVCHVRAHGTPERPTRLDEIGPGCLSPSYASALTDPLDSTAFPIDYPSERLVRVCASFERAEITHYWTAATTFEAATGCVSRNLGLF